MRKLFAFAAFAAFLSLPAVALADCYVNPKGDLGTYKEMHGCYEYGATARCIGSSNVRFYFDRNHEIACNVSIWPNGSSKWHADTTTWYYRTNHRELIECTQRWENDNTLDVTGKRIK